MIRPLLLRAARLAWHLIADRVRGRPEDGRYHAMREHWGTFTEQQAIRSRGDDYRAYQRETSAFFPWFPKRA